MIQKPRKPVAFLSNKALLSEIAKSKLTYCSFIDPADADYQLIVDGLDAITPALMAGLDTDTAIIRVNSYSHIPLVQEGEKMPTRCRNRNHTRVCFPPFAHYRVETVNNELVITEVGRSHWVGGLQNGHFSNAHGRLTPTLGRQIMTLVERYARKGNWSSYSFRDEMEGTAMGHLCAVILSFDESKSDNPFSYATSCMRNSFIKVLNDEKKKRDMRDDLLVSYGHAPSMTRQVEDELKKYDPVALVRKAGRPKKVK